MSVHWIDPLNRNSVILTKTDGTTKIELNVGDCIKYSGPVGRPDGVKIISFRSKEFNSKPDVGPIGVIYLPWRKDQQRWASPAFSMKGDPRHIICYPVGLPHYGEHIDWDTVEIIPNPELLVKNVIDY